MKKILFLLLVSTKLFATDYYFATGGSDGNSGLSPASPKQTIGAMNTLAAIAGNNILLNRGDTWYGAISGINNNVTFDAYGSGAKPIITGLTAISSWTNLGSNIYEATVSGSPSAVNMVVIAGQVVPMGRWPNRDSANLGYRTIASSVANTSITDAATLYGTWTGADMIVRNNDFTTRRLPITGRSSNTLTYTGTMSAVTAGYGYFIENALATLDRNGEWFYDVAAGKIKMYYTSTPPTIQVSTVKSLVDLVYTSGTKKHGITFNNISFVGCDSVMFPTTYVDTLTIDGCDLQFAGNNFIDLRYTPYLTVSNSTFKDAATNGISLFSNYVLSHHITVTNNTFNRVGVYPGLIPVNYLFGTNNTGIAINIGCGDLLVKENTIDSIGYIGICIGAQRDNQIIRKNFITHIGLTKNDGGGIYNSGLRGDPVALNVIIDSNIVGITYDSAWIGTPSINRHIRGIYLDATSTAMQIRYNTTFSCWEGIYFSQSQYLLVSNNTIFDCGFYSASPANYAGALSIQDAVGGYQHTTYNRVTNNLLFAKLTDQLQWYMFDAYYGADSVGVIDSNYYVNPGSNTRLFTYNPGFPNQYFTLSAWQTAHSSEGYDVHSHDSPITTPTLTAANWFNYIRFEYNATNSPVVRSLGGYNCTDAYGNSYPNTATIPAWSSKVFFIGTVYSASNIIYGLWK